MCYSGDALRRTERNVRSEPTNGTDERIAVNFSPYIEVLRGRDGRDGLPGPHGRDGSDGKEGERGEKGDPGIAGPTGPPGPHSGGMVYTRWGRTTCPDTQGTELVYEGIAAGSSHTHKGGGVNYLCLPEEPEYWSDYQAGDYGAGYVYGAEYEAWKAGPLHSMYDHNVPCAVCYTTTRESVLMLPARITCPQHWTLEYNGYLMSDRHTHYRKTYECMDKNPESIAGSNPDTNGALFYFNEVSCSSDGVPCPPYDSQKELTCAVCTR